MPRVFIGTSCQTGSRAASCIRRGGKNLAFDRNWVVVKDWADVRSTLSSGNAADCYRPADVLDFAGQNTETGAFLRFTSTGRS